MEVDLQQVQHITGGRAQCQRQNDLQQRLEDDAHRVDAALLQGVRHAVGSREQHQAHGIVDGHHHQQQVGQRAGSFVLLDHHQGGGGCRSGRDGTQRDGRRHGDDVRAGKVQRDEGRVHQRRGDDGLRNAHRDGLAAHALEGTQAELVADDEGDEAQRHLGDDAVAFHSGKAVKAEADAAEAQPPQKERAQQQPGDQIRGDSRKVHRLCKTGHQQACDEREGQTDQHLLHGSLCGNRP